MKKLNLKTIIRKDIAEMEEYTPVTSLWDLADTYDLKIPDVIKLDAGENQLGFSSKVLEALNTQGLFNFYPDPEYKELRQALASYTRAPIESIIVGSGSDELLDLLFRLVLEAGDKVINCPPTFGMYPVLTKLNKGRIVSVPRKENFALDIEKIQETLDENVKIIVICTPNNPTGTVTSEKEIISLLDTGKLVIIDEAYFEFSSKTVAPLVAKYPNLIVLRTLSKWAGLAGLRIGYGVMDPFLVTQLFKIKPPYNVNLAASIAGIAALEDKKWSKKTIGTVVRERERMAGAVGRLAGLTVYPSEANSLFIRLNQDLGALKSLLEKKKIAVRYYDAYQAMRLSVGTRTQNDTVLVALKEFSKQKFDSVIFDMDGVLVDVTNSYRQAIKKTVETVLADKYGKNTVVTMSDIDAMKRIPGFNNDWDLSYELTKLLANDIKQKDFGRNTASLDKQTKNSQEYQSVKDIFQSFYLGEKLFIETYNRKPPVLFSKGLIANETLLLDLSILKSLSKIYKLGVATSRPRFEALFALKNLGLTPSFIDESNVVALEDVRREKPFPDPLLAAQKRLQSKSPVYIGDTVNDLLAAREASMSCIFVGTNKQADYQVSTTNQIKGILL
jgi:histidinol-phosphate aminotransferase